MRGAKVSENRVRKKKIAAKCGSKGRVTGPATFLSDQEG